MSINLINNIAFLVALVAAGQLVLAHFGHKSLRRRILLGLLFGGVALLGMVNPVNFVPGIIFDGRSIVLSVAGVIGGGWVAGIAAGIAAFYRYQLGGLGAPVGITTIVLSALLGTLAHYWWKRWQTPPKLLHFLGLGLVVQLAQLLAFTQIPNQAGYVFIEQAWWLLLSIYPLATMLLCQIFRNYENQLESQIHQKLASSVYEHSSEGVLIADKDAKILSVNPAFTAITGYEEAEALGKKPNILRSDHHNPEFYRAMWDTLKQQGFWEGEIWNRRKNGEAYQQWLTINCITNHAGEPVRYVSVFHDITEMRRKDDHIRHQAFHDALTGLPNRALFQERLQHAIDRSRREGERLAVTFIDLDGFKNVNDTLGHDIGDTLLQEVSHRIRAHLRREVDTVARLGGDEFVVLIEDLRDANLCGNLSNDIIASLSSPFQLGNHEVHIGASLGVAFYPEDGKTVQELMKCADTAMYAAKRAGKGAYRFFQASMLQEVVNRLAFENELRVAVKKEQFVLHYQPQLDLRSRRIVGVEALVRWQHPERGMISPLAFIPVAEEIGLITQLGDWVLQEACQQLAKWRANGLTDIKMSVNLSAKQFADSSLPMRIEKALQETGLPATCLDLELTESMTMKEPTNAAAMMRVLTAQQLTLSIDDFGTGYSSLAYLKLFPINTLKIDRTFVKDIETDPDDAGICDVTVLLAHKLELDVVAEGVETIEQLNFLLSIGCEKIQGYLISKPLPGDEAEAFIRSNPTFNELGTVELW